jgi:hypothetical protein
MRFESQWPGDAIAALVCGMYDPEDALFDCLGGRSWNGVDRRSNLADAGSDRGCPERLAVAFEPAQGPPTLGNERKTLSAMRPSRGDPVRPRTSADVGDELGISGQHR